MKAGVNYYGIRIRKIHPLIYFKMKINGAGFKVQPWTAPVCGSSL